MKWKDKLINDLLDSIIKIGTEENNQLIQLINQEAVSIHLAIFSEPFLSLMFSGQKTMESRFSINNVIPYRKIAQNDLVLIKKSGGSIIGLFIVDKVFYFSNLNQNKIQILEHQHGEKLAWSVDPEFINNKSSAKYLTLIDFKKVNRISPIETNKKDRTGWSIVRIGFQNTLFDYGNKQD